MVADMAVMGRQFIRDYLIDQHRRFYGQLPFAVFGAVDDDGLVWASPRAGLPGFLNAKDPKHLRIMTVADHGDPANAGFRNGKAVAMIGIEPATRRRNRLNGRIEMADEGGFVIEIDEAFGNCPQYIQRRSPSYTRDPGTLSSVAPEALAAIDEAGRAMIGSADSFYVASFADTPKGRRVDVSHRGGRPGFVRIDEDGTLTVPDFAGNQFFNTLGNIRETGKAGLVFIDWSTGDLLQISGDAEVVLDSPEIAAFTGAERLWRVRPRRIVRRVAGLPLTWQFEDDAWSPNLAATGTWAEAEAKIEAARLGHAWRQFRIARIVEESSVIRSFHLEPIDSAGLAAYQAGQHLPVRVSLPGEPRPLVRTYTLSSAPGDRLYRISVKREGVVSGHLHGLAAGDVVEARAPAGAFTIDAAASHPAVLLAAGIGITPILSMARHLILEGARTRKLRRAWIIYSARSAQERAFADEISAIVRASQGAIQAVRVLSRADGASANRDYDYRGRIDVDLLRNVLPFDDYDFYLCGPSAFMQDVYDGLRGLSIADARIHAEAFGPAAMTRTPDPTTTPSLPVTVPAEGEVDVAFAAAGASAKWVPGKGSLLELAEASGLSPEYGCRSGNCGSCRTRVLAGSVVHTRAVGAEIRPDEALICCAVPAKGSGSISLQL
ncbi:pyridoxamine 5'-phosphate oxidase family protein [Sphingobium yanoikuyae]|uniref:2Fe-2S iron-sulfur cluster-binding protein n=1 Tax=Sphingobium yanoikuyae TaxID=13690 RepID=UPI001F23EA29|nr:pyridoxamine 5'-phosphate oxidase family protein [Sphingobium yanoikuyae]